MHSSKQPAHRLPYGQNILTFALCITASMVGTGCIIGLMRLRYSYQTTHPLQTEEQSTHSTVLPFRKDPVNCEKNGGLWLNQECVDHAHDPTF
ncbi:MAG: hypothetical protein AAF282_04815 [Cyanobacteria bacterium P01_A01_bin.15]